MNSFIVYEHVNKINGKRYIGITKQAPEVRWQRGLGYRKNKHFNDAINRYGWDSFEHIIIAEGLTVAEAQIIERELISEYKTQDKRFGYNITNGGEHFLHSAESKALISERRRGKGLHVFSEEHKRKIKEHHAGGDMAKKVVCVETGELFDSINDASRAKGINKKGISGCCRKAVHYNTAGGFHWEYAR